MRLHLGPIPIDPTFQPEAEGWRRLREPGPLAIQMIAFPVAVLVALALFLYLILVSPDLQVLLDGGLLVLIDISGLNWVGALLGLFLIVTIHEVIHALLMPGFGRTPQTIIAFWPAKILFYAPHLGPIPRNQFLLVLLAPIFILTILPVTLISYLAQFSGTLVLQIWLALIALLNGVSASGDLVTFAYLLAQTPPRSLLRNQGWKSYWKANETSPS